METNLKAGNAMTTDNNNLTPDTATKASWGAQFEAARKAMHLNEKDAAARLHLKPHIITIIETENFQDGPPAIFMRGYIRSYGRMLNFSEKEIAQALAQMDLANPATTAYAPVQTRIETPTHSNSHVGWSTAFVVLGLSALVGMWWWNAHTNHNPGVEAAATPLPDATPSAAQTAVTSTATPDNNPALNSTPNNIAANTNSITDSTTPPVATPAPTPAPTATTAQNTPAPVAATPAPATPVAAPTPATTADATAPATGATAPSTAPTATPPTTASTEKPVISEPTSLPSLEEDEADANATQPAAKPHKHKTPDMADAEMSVPEEGLDDSPQ